MGQRRGVHVIQVAPADRSLRGLELVCVLVAFTLADGKKPKLRFQQLGKHAVLLREHREVVSHLVQDSLRREHAHVGLAEDFERGAARDGRQNDPKGSGRLVDFRWVHVFTFGNGKIVAFEEPADVSELVAEFRRAQARA